LTRIAVSVSLCSAALGARLLSPALILRSSASSPMGIECLRHPYRRDRRAVRRSDRRHLGQLPLACQSPSALRHAGRELGEKNVATRRDAIGRLAACNRIFGSGRSSGSTRCRSCAALRPVARARAAHHRGNTGNIATSCTCAGCRY
jgi:hypothetical protein